MTIIAVPYHLDEYLADLDFPLEAAEVVTAEFPPGGAWERLAVLYAAVSRGVAADAGRGGCPVVLTGDCLTALGTVAGPLYVHVDMDVIDAAGLPGLRYPVPGGPSAGQLADALRALLGTGRVAALGLACTWYAGHGAAQQVSPLLDAILGHAA